jgi:hypothetical protein
MTGKFCTPAPKAIVFGTELCVNVGSAAVEPVGTWTLNVTIDVDFSVVCNEPGQFIRPGDWQATPL